MTGIRIEWKEDPFAPLGEGGTLAARLETVHGTVRKQFPFIDRMAVALADTRAAQLKTFIHSSGGASPLVHYQASLEQVPSLREAVEKRRVRVVNDLDVFGGSRAEHTRKILERGYRSSCAYPFFQDGKLGGFVFYDSCRSGSFDETTVDRLSPYTHLVTGMISGHLDRLATMLASLRSAIGMMHFKDPETGSHLERMSRYSRIIAQELALTGRYDFSDEFTEYLYAFAPMHDVGKIGTPDRILSKPGGLDPEESEIMHRHARTGREVIDAILADFGFEGFPYADVLRHVAEFHHEKLDGSGYPRGLRHREIPIEARIVAVSDVFDALTSARPYKRAWSNDEAVAHLSSLAGVHFDADCIDALIRRRREIEEVQDLFVEPA